ncbi:MAG: PilZ domain-containing protein [Candidatus Omnitrophica bacterium]|nr:PilZ domain-containing protein [Candidatus Omnitrophota bacterium]
MQEKRRIYFRLKVKFPVLFRRGYSDNWYPAEAVDVSTNGVGFMTQELLKDEEELTLRFSLPWQFRKIKGTAFVRHQSEKQEQGGARRYFIGVQFEEISDQDIKYLGRYIVQSMNLVFPRIFLLGIGFGVSLWMFLKGVNYYFIQQFWGTPFGNEWLDPEWARIPLMPLFAFHSFYALIICLCGIGLFYFRKWAFRSYLLLAVGGVGMQLYRLVTKTSLLSENLFFRSVYFAEFICFLALCGAVIVMAQIWSQFNSIFASMEEHMMHY